MTRGKARRVGGRGATKGTGSGLNWHPRGEAVKMGGSERQLQRRSNERGSIERGSTKRDRPQKWEIATGKRH